MAPARVLQQGPGRMRGGLNYVFRKFLGPALLWIGKIYNTRLVCQCSHSGRCPHRPALSTSAGRPNQLGSANRANLAAMTLFKDKFSMSYYDG